MASANGELRASVVIVRLAYSSYVKWICSLNNKSMRVVAIKKIINGINIVKTEFKCPNNWFPWLLNIANTASAKNTIWYFEKKLVISFNLLFKINLVICADKKGITITIINEYTKLL